MSETQSVHHLKPTRKTIKHQRHIRVGGTNVTYTHEAPQHQIPFARLYLLPGLLGCELSYSVAQHHIAQTFDLEIVTLTHDRTVRQIFHPRKQRSQDCHEVMKDADKSFGIRPRIILGHSLGGGDGASEAHRSLSKNKGQPIIALGLDSSVGLNGHVPNLIDGYEFLHDEILGARHISREQVAMMFGSLNNYTKNPVLAAVEAVCAATANIRNAVDEIDESIPTAEFFSYSDRLVPPPVDRPRAIIRSDRSLGHLALVLEPEVATATVGVLLDRAA